MVRRAAATLTSAPWRRAPLLLLRRPIVLASAAGACLVLAASMAAVPLLLSSSGTAALERQASGHVSRLAEGLELAIDDGAPPARWVRYEAPVVQDLTLSEAARLAAFYRAWPDLIDEELEGT
ncbi:MAG: hypothetical protein ACRD0A_12895, partial [Acidimicrobiales bacterium]